MKMSACLRAFSTFVWSLRSGCKIVLYICVNWYVNYMKVKCKLYESRWLNSSAARRNEHDDLGKNTGSSSESGK